MEMFPVDAVQDRIAEALAVRGSAVLVAPPGAGKTTRVPLALLVAPWLDGRKIIMLEPRRLAARLAASFMAKQMGEEAGGHIGYRTRLETKAGPHTRLEVVTEGVLTRMLQRDPALGGVGLVVFDEFHERSLQSDLGLALCLQARELFRPDLRVLVMSATLDAAPVSDLLGHAPVIVSEGRAYPVETHYRRHPAEVKLDVATASAVRKALAETEGDVLVFLPGAAEIRRTAERLVDVGQGVRVVSLFGDMSRDAQDDALTPATAGTRKVILATSIAETSLTIPGVRTVIDSGLARVPRFSPRTGLTRLETVRVSRAGSDQRRGRAGRLGPGTCYRLWTRGEHEHLEPFRRPEILDSDLAPLVLELATWGARDPGALSWLDQPRAAAVARATDLLKWLEALDENGVPTSQGFRMADIGVHPRLAHLLLHAEEKGSLKTATRIAALLGARDIMKGEHRSADIRLRLEVLERAGAEAYVPPDVDRVAVRQILRESDLIRKKLNHRSGTPTEAPDVGALIALAYPERIAQRRGEGRFMLRSGHQALLGRNDPLADEEWLAVAEIDGRPADARIFLAAPIHIADVRTLFATQIVEEVQTDWDDASKRPIVRRRERLGALLLSDVRVSRPLVEWLWQATIDAIRSRGLSLLEWTPDSEHLLDRLRFVRHHFPDWPDFDEAVLLHELDEWLRPFLNDSGTFAGLDLKEPLLSRLSHDQRSSLEHLAPPTQQVPTGSRIRIDYSDPEAPSLSVRLQELFGEAQTPRVAGGRIPLTLRLLSPAQRPVQITRDLEGFWKNSYFEVRKDLRGRYPKHYWPDNPLEAEPTRRTKRRI